MSITFGSVCSGIEAASVAWRPLGWRAAWLSEIEPFPCALLAHHYPDVPNLGDMTQLPERIVLGEVPAPDVFCGGTPCQAFSVAGLRNSLDDARGNLSLTFCEIANAIDISRAADGKQPCVIFWENVPGVLSTKDNAFGCFLAGLAGEDDAIVTPGGKWSNAGYVLGPQRAVAWRVLDAQYFGVAQRRRRVFVVASARTDFDPAAVLLEFDSLRRDSAPSRKAWKDAAVFTPGSIGGYREGFGTLRANGGDIGGGSENLVAKCLTAGGNMRYDYDTEDFIVHGTKDPCTSKDAAFALGRNQGGENVIARPIPHAEFMPTMASGASTEAAHGARSGHTKDAYIVPMEVPQTFGGMSVRRLTPIECERLQGFPDDYTNIPWRGKPEAPDGPRYKALGNSWAVPVVRWIGRRIKLALEVAA